MNKYIKDSIINYCARKISILQPRRTVNPKGRNEGVTPGNALPDTPTCVDMPYGDMWTTY